MIQNENIFHLAIPTHNIEAAKEFYVDGLGCEVGRIKNDRVTLDFFGDQVVCHLASEDDIVEDDELAMYPRHFGITVVDESDFDAIIHRAETHNLPFFQEPMKRFAGQHDEHRTFFLKDPSNNLLEFKWYKNPESMY